MSLSMSRPEEVRAYLIARSVENPVTGCRTWQRSTSSQGKYGTLWVDGRIEYVHRVAYALDHDLPAGSLAHETDSVEVHHSCGLRTCIAPKHLQSLTRRRHADLHRPVHAAVRLAKAA
jgi:hypothetical protein